MWRQGINQLLLFGTYDYMKQLFFGLKREVRLGPLCYF